jgi:hypothetical protein
MQSNTVSNALFDILESEATDKYYLPSIDNEGWSKEPTFIICTSMYAKLGTSSWTAYMGRGLMDWTFKTQKRAQAQVLDAISKSKKPITQVKWINSHNKTKILSIQQVKK